MRIYKCLFISAFKSKKAPSIIVRLPIRGTRAVELLPIAEVNDVVVCAPEDAFISFYNSPYYSHKGGAAIDIYLSHRDGDFAPSPIEGRVKKIYRFKPPTLRFFPTQDREDLIILESRGRPALYVRLLHIVPSVKVGDQVSVGDELGSLIRSGFFNFWTDLHIHVDVRGNGNLVRAKGSLPLHPLSSQDKALESSGDIFQGLEVLSVQEDYTLLKARNTSRLGRFWGVGCTVGETGGLLDGGIPHYSCGGVYLPTSTSVHVGEKVKLGGTIIGTVERLDGTMAFFRGEPLWISINDHKLRGLSLYLFLSDQQTIKLIPEKPMKLPFHTGESVDISIQPM